MSWLTESYEKYYDKINEEFLVEKQASTYIAEINAAKELNVVQDLIDSANRDAKLSYKEKRNINDAGKQQLNDIQRKLDREKEKEIEYGRLHNMFYDKDKNDKPKLPPRMPDVDLDNGNTGKLENDEKLGNETESYLVNKSYVRRNSDGTIVRMEPTNWIEMAEKMKQHYETRLPREPYERWPVSNNDYIFPNAATAIKWCVDNGNNSEEKIMLDSDEADNRNQFAKQCTKLYKVCEYGKGNKKKTKTADKQLYDDWTAYYWYYPTHDQILDALENNRFAPDRLIGTKQVDIEQI